MFVCTLQRNHPSLFYTLSNLPIFISKLLFYWTLIVRRRAEEPARGVCNGNTLSRSPNKKTTAHVSQWFTNMEELNFYNPWRKGIRCYTSSQNIQIKSTLIIINPH